MLETVDRFLIQGKVSFRASGNSMLPLIKSGDELFFQARPFSAIRVNDLVLFKQHSQYTVHRVIYRTRKYLICKGDNNLEPDNKIYPGQVLGIVTKIKQAKKTFALDSVYLLQSGFYLQEINRLKRQFDQNKLDYLFLKGLPLYLYYDKKHPKRIYADCDVLISSQDLGKAKKILLKGGYLQVNKRLFSFMSNYSQYEPELVFYKKISGFEVFFDLHQELVFQMTELGKLEALYPHQFLKQLTSQALSQKRVVRAAGEKYFVLSSEMLIVYLALHLFHHNFVGAARYNFLQQVIKVEVRTGRLEWSKIYNIITHFCLANYVYPVFVLYNRFYNPRVSQDFINKLEILTSRLVKRQWQKINPFAEQGRLAAGVTRFQYLFWFSPQPLWFRLTVFFRSQVWLAFLWSLKQYFLSLKMFKHQV